MSHLSSRQFTVVPTIHTSLCTMITVVEIFVGCQVQPTSTEMWTKQIYIIQNNEKMDSHWVVSCKKLHSHIFASSSKFLTRSMKLYSTWGKYCKQHCWALCLSLHQTGKVIFIIELGGRFPRSPSVASSSAAATSTTTTSTSPFSGTPSTSSSSGVSIEYKLETIHQVLLPGSFFILWKREKLQVRTSTNSFYSYALNQGYFVHRSYASVLVI